MRAERRKKERVEARMRNKTPHWLPLTDASSGNVPGRHSLKVTDSATVEKK